MGLQSLRDKLLQAGLVTQEQAEKAETDRPHKQAAPKGRHPADPGRRPGSDRGKGPRGGGRNQQAGRQRQQQVQLHRELTPEEKLALEEEAAFKERERMLNQEREENRRRAAEDRKRLEGLRAIAESFEIEERGEEVFFFTTRKKKLQRIYLTAQQIERLNLGDLAIIDKPLPSELSYALVNREAAERALILDSKALRFYNRGFGQTFGFKAEPPPGGEEGLEAEAAAEGSAGGDGADAKAAAGSTGGAAADVDTAAEGESNDSAPEPAARTPSEA